MSASTTQAKTIISKGREGWEAKTIIGMGAKNRLLVIHTYKCSGGMVNTFCIFTDMGDGGMSCELFGDYSKRTTYKGTRCTEKTVRDLHAQALSVSDLHMRDAAEFYAKKDAAKDVTFLHSENVELGGFSDPMHY